MFCFSEDFGDILSHDSDSKKLYAADKNNDTNKETTKTKKKKTITINKNMKLSKTKISLAKGQKLQFKLPKSLSGKVTFLSKNKKIATVSKKGIVTAKKKGKVKIIIKKGKKKKVLTLTIK